MTAPQVDDWDEHWARFSDSASRNPAQHYRHRIVAHLVVEAQPKRIVDIGAGGGDLLARLDEMCPSAHLFGCELSQIGVDQASSKVPRAIVQQLDLMSDDAEASVQRIAADVGVCCEVLEHLDDPSRFLERAKLLLAPGATLIVTVPGGPRSEFDRVIGHRRHYSPKALASLLRSCGFDVQSAVGAGFPFFNLYRLTVIARGAKLADDVAGDETSRLARFAMKTFDVLFRFNLKRGLGGWQTIAVARVSESSASPAPEARAQQ